MFYITGILLFPSQVKGQVTSQAAPGYDIRIRDFVDTITVFDTHEHLFNPELLKNTTFLDFSLLLQQNCYDQLISAGMPDTLMKQLFLVPCTPLEKWKLIQPWWDKSFNTVPSRILLPAVKNLYGIDGLNETTVEALSEKIKSAYNTPWPSLILKKICRIDYVIEDGDSVGKAYDFVKYAFRFNSWLTMRTKFRIDSLAVMQVEPIFTLEDYVKSMENSFNNALKSGMKVVKINLAYQRPLRFENVTFDAARKIFRSLVNGNEDFSLSSQEARPLQDFMVHRLLEMAEKNKIPVAFHTGLQAGANNILDNSDPRLLVNLFDEYPDIDFVLFHGSYPFGGELASLARNFRNVFIDMNWTYSISPEYAERYLTEWLESVPVSKIMAFGGDQRCVENIYGNLLIARRVVSNVLIRKVREGYFSEEEAKLVARLILHDNGARFYGLYKNHVI